MRMISLFLAAAFALTACGREPTNELAGHWQVQQIAGASLGEGVDIWIEIPETGEAVTGFTGCNSFDTTLSRFGATIAFGPVTKGAGQCPDQAAATDEARFLQTLPAVQRYIRRGRSLELLQAPAGSETLIRLRLADEPTGG